MEEETQEEYGKAVEGLGLRGPTPRREFLRNAIHRGKGSNMKRASDYELHLAGLVEAFDPKWQNDMTGFQGLLRWQEKLKELRNIATRGREAAEWAARYAFITNALEPGKAQLDRESASKYHDILERAARKLDEFAEVLKELDGVE